jgi:hypothetical protein
MADTALNIGINTSANLGGLNQTVAAINQVTAAQQRQAQTQARLNDVGGALAGGFGIPITLGAAIGSVIGFGRAVVDMVGRVKDGAEQLDVTTDEFQRLDSVARNAGFGVGAFAGALSQLGAARRAAAEGNEGLRATFARFGLSLEDLNDPAKRNIDLLRQMGAAMGNLTAADRTALRDVLGRQGDRLAGALGELNSAAGAVVSNEAIQQIDKAAKSWEQFMLSLKVSAAEAYNTVLKLTYPMAALLRGADNVQNAPSNFDRDLKAYRLDKAAIDRGQITEEQASAGFKRIKSFNDARAASPSGRLDYDTHTRANARPDGSGGLFADRAAAQQLAELDSKRTENAEKRRKLEFDQLTPAQQRADIERRLAEQKFAQGSAESVGDKRQAADFEGRALDLEAELRAFDKQAPRGEAGNAPLTANAWERMGANFGGNDRTQELLQVQRDTHRAVQQMAVSLDSFAALARMGVPVTFRDE